MYAISAFLRYLALSLSRSLSVRVLWSPMMTLALIALNSGGLSAAGFNPATVLANMGASYVGVGSGADAAAWCCAGGADGAVWIGAGVVLDGWMRFLAGSPHAAVNATAANTLNRRRLPTARSG